MTKIDHFDPTELRHSMVEYSRFQYCQPKMLRLLRLNHKIPLKVFYTSTSIHIITYIDSVLLKLSMVSSLLLALLAVLVGLVAEELVLGHNTFSLYTSPVCIHYKIKTN